MTKRDIIKFLERKQTEKEAAVKAEFKATLDQIYESAYAGLGLTDTANRMQELFSQIGNIWNDWKQQHENTAGLKFFTGYHSVENLMYIFNNENGDTLKMLTDNSVRVTPDAADALRRQYKEQFETVNKTFQAVTATVQQMKYTKEAAAYLRELGFDLSELENPGDQAQMALLVPVDTRYLFVKAA